MEKKANRALSFPSLVSLRIDGNLLTKPVPRLLHRNFQDALLELCFDFVWNDIDGKGECSREGPICPLHPVELFLTHGFLQLSLALNGNSVVADTELDRILIHFWKLCLQDDVPAGLIQIH